MLTRRLAVRRGGRRRARARAGHRRRVRDRWTSTLLRPARRRPAGHVVAVVGRRLSRAATTSWACCWAPVRPTTTGAGAPRSSTPPSPRPARPPTKPRQTAAYDRAEDHRPARRPGHPDELRHGLGAVPRRAPRGRAERARAPAAGGPGMGRLTAPRHRSSRAAGAPRWPSARRAAARGRAPPTRTFGTPTIDADVRPGHRVHASRSTLDAAPSGSSCCDLRRQPTARSSSRSRRRRGATTLDLSTADVDRRPHPAQHPGRGALADHRRRADAEPVGARRSSDVYDDDRFAWKTARGRRRPRPLVRGRRGVRRSAPSRSARRPWRRPRRCSA